MTRQRRLAYISLLINAMLWGAALPLVKLALPYTTPFRWLFYRYLFAAPLSLPLLIYFLLKTKLRLKQILVIIGLELIGTTAVLASLYQGLRLTSAIEASLISATAPIFVTLGGIFFLKEKEEKHEWLGLTLALIGTILIALEPVINQTNQSLAFSLLGNGLVLLQNLLWAVYLLFAKRYYQKIPKFICSGISFWVGLISFFILAQIQLPLSNPLTELNNPLVLGAALYMGIFGSIIALTLYIYAQNLIEASEASLFNYLNPLFAIPLSVVFLKESLQASNIIAIIIIAIGVILAEARPAKPSNTK